MSATTRPATDIDVRRPRRIDCALTGPSTPAGRYLRKFWNPVYHSADIAPGTAVPLRILGESFTLYRGETGTLHLVQARCPHRGTLLSTGWIEGDEIRCFYHGWKFDPEGRCTEQPAEESAFVERIRIQSWPVREYLGLVFAYLGEDTPPELPRYREFEEFEGIVEVDSYVRDCNFFQNLENALDMAHVGFVHADNRASFRDIGLGRALRAVESDWGVTYTFTRADGKVRVQQFGMPNIFHMTALPNEEDVDWQESLFWWVPIDDTRHMQFSLHRVPLKGDAAIRFKERRQRRRSSIDIPHQTVCEAILTGRKRLQDVDPQRVDMVRLQDDIAQLGQGRLADRRAEKLGRADVGVIATRRLWEREISALLDGRPLKSWTRTPAIVPAVWGLQADRDEQLRLSATDTGARAEIIDIRPYVEVELQLDALHGAGTDGAGEP
ncbi:MAG: Rieske 2Fe-2S domain-containing protein [Pigmentiphaga sp.]|uniref:Rieske 2Fe-2S domain-containing protein n=1 Tax=Pigmentiphaga sp. TaxID=1977564 RepID=UPI0029AA6BCD|nr:Rieske 2Fe-2S domain-containing protein [Pigmentiphaga sp.]MDX3905623.1 Rieske 2Fe-2S domain-containing protein [Pigmentiphaga sp.]